MGLCVLTLPSLNAQLSDGSIAPDWTLTDIFGNEYNLYELLDQGKTVVLDFSATWCGPCWNYHNTHFMANFYEEHGPDGDGQSMAFFIESDMSTGLDDLYGETDQSQGDWVTGTPYPIMNPTVYDVVANYAIAYFPTIYKICPNKQIYEVGQVSDQIFEYWIESCTMEADVTSTSGTICYGLEQGSADLDASGGYGSINYHWSNGDITQDLENVEAGTYAVTVSEGMGREIFIDDVEISGPLTPIEVTDFAITDLLCYEDGSGTIAIDADGGNGGFTYYWSNGDSGPMIESLEAGSYTVTVSDAQGCEITESFVVYQPDLLEQTMQLEDDHCSQYNGEVLVLPGGGTGPYTLETTGGTIFPGSYRIINLTEGDYAFTLTDVNGCSLTQDFSITNIPGPDVVMPQSPEVTCATGPAMLVPFVINDAEGDLEFTWTTPDGEIIGSSNDLICTVGAPGTYYLNVEDLEFGCDLLVSMEVLGSVEEPIVDAGPDLQITCEQQAVQPTVTLESNGDFIYEWTTSDGQILSGSTTLAPVFGDGGTYHLLIVNNLNGCSGTEVVVVTDDRVLPQADFSFSPEELSVSFIANSPGDAYHWDFGDGSTSDLAEVNHVFAIGGTYHVCLTVTNACGSVEQCKDILVENGASVILVELSISNITCHGASDGALAVQAFGGSGTYTFEWLAPGGNTLSGAEILGLAPGTYILTVSDDQGNSTQVQATITEPSTIVSSTQLIPPGGPHGPGIDLTVDGGAQGYMYLWNNGATTQDLHLLRSGTYQCTVTDANGCVIITEPIRIVNPKDIIIRPPGEIVHVIGSPRFEPLTVIIDSDASALHAVRVYDILGRPHTAAEWIGTSGNVDLRQFHAGVYFLAVFENDQLLKTVRLALND